MRFVFLITLVNAIGYLISILLSHALSGDEFGRALYAINIASLLSAVSMLGFGELSLREAFVQRKTINSAVFLASFAVLIAISLGVSSTPEIAKESSYRKFVIMTAILVFMSEYTGIVLRIKERYLALAILGRPLPISMFAMLATATFWGFSWGRALWSTVGLTALYTTIVMRVASGETAWRPSEMPSSAIKSIRLWIDGILFMGQMQAGAYILAQTHDMPQVGTYSLSLLPVNAVTMIASAYFSVFLQGDFFKKHGEDARKALNFVASQIGIGILIAVMVWVCGSIVVLVATEAIYDTVKYKNLKVILEIMVIAAGVRAPQVALGMRMKLEETIQSKNKISVKAYSAGFGIGLILAQKLGVIGVGIGFLFAELMQTSLLWADFDAAAKAEGYNAKYLVLKKIKKSLEHTISWCLARARQIIKPHEKIAIIGHFGFQNFGDDILAIAARKCAGMVQVENILVPCTDELDWSCTKSLKQRLFARLYARRHLGLALRAYAKARAMIECSDVVYAGGSLFVSPSGQRITIESAAVRAGLKFHALAVSVGPFPNDEIKANTINHLKTFRTISVRDRRSMLLLKDNGINAEYVPDLAYSLGSEIKTIQNSVRRSFRVALVPAEIDSMEMAEQWNFFRNTISILSKNGVLYDILLMQPSDYKRLPSDLAETQNLIIYDGRWAEMVSRLAKYSHVISSRLHAGIVSHIMEKPFYLYPHHQKSIDFCIEVGLYTQTASEFLKNLNSWLAEETPKAHSAEDVTKGVHTTHLKKIKSNLTCE